MMSHKEVEKALAPPTNTERRQPPPGKIALPTLLVPIPSVCVSPCVCVYPVCESLSFGSCSCKSDQGEEIHPIFFFFFGSLSQKGKRWKWFLLMKIISRAAIKQINCHARRAKNIQSTSIRYLYPPSLPIALPASPFLSSSHFLVLVLGSLSWSWSCPLGILQNEPARLFPSRPWCFNVYRPLDMEITSYTIKLVSILKNKWGWMVGSV